MITYCNWSTTSPASSSGRTGRAIHWRSTHSREASSKTSPVPRSRQQRQNCRSRSSISRIRWLSSFGTSLKSSGTFSTGNRQRSRRIRTYCVHTMCTGAACITHEWQVVPFPKINVNKHESAYTHIHTHVFEEGRACAASRFFRVRNVHTSPNTRILEFFAIISKWKVHRGKCLRHF